MQKLCDIVGTLKATVTYPENHLDKAVVAVSLYNKKLVYLMSTITKSITWIKNKESLE